MGKLKLRPSGKQNDNALMYRTDFMDAPALALMEAASRALEKQGIALVFVKREYSGQQVPGFQNKLMTSRTGKHALKPSGTSA